MQFGTNVLQVNTPRLMSRIFDLSSHFHNGGHDVISRRKVLPSGECTRSVCPAHMQQSPPVPDP